MTDDTHEQNVRDAYLALTSRLAEGQDAMAIVARISQGSLELSGLDNRTFALVRAAALAASGAPTASWDLLLQIASEAGIDSSEIYGTLVAIAPVIGTARFSAACDALLGR